MNDTLLSGSPAGAVLMRNTDRKWRPAGAAPLSGWCRGSFCGGDDKADVSHAATHVHSCLLLYFWNIKNKKKTGEKTDFFFSGKKTNNSTCLGATFESCWSASSRLTDTVESLLQAGKHRVNKIHMLQCCRMNRLCLQPQTYWVHTGSRMDPIEPRLHSGVTVLLLCLLEPHVSVVVALRSVGSASVDWASCRKVRRFHHPIKS